MERETQMTTFPQDAIATGPGAASPASLGRALVERVRNSALTRPTVAVSLSAASIVLLVLVGAGAPDNHTLPSALPLLPLPPMPGLASTVAMFTSITLSCLGLIGLLGANSRGWRPSPRKLLYVGTAVVAVVANLAPVGSSDTASYAAYGRIAELGGDPYVTTPVQLGGSYAHLVSNSWLRTPSVYGPVATWIQAAAAQIGGHRPWVTIWLLMLANGAAFLATGYILTRIADDPVRAGLMWVANPLLIVLLVAGGHLDTLVATLTVCAVHWARRAFRPRDDVIVGLCTGLAGSVKISAALLVPALLWPLVRERAWRRAALQASVCAGVLLATYSWYGLHALAPLSTASHLVSIPSVWAAVQQVGHACLGPAATATAINASWPVLTVALGWLIHRKTSPSPAPLTTAAPFALAFAWILLAPWSMPWYTAMIWALAALLPRGPMVRWLILTTAMLTLCHNSGGHSWSW
jgi:hypothetical protein